uniref:Uncharacterized protein n=1 Tax=Oryza meridionalis TaxID=40149 RepID=A0A0E0C293_9ORYZ
MAPRSAAAAACPAKPTACSPSLASSISPPSASRPPPVLPSSVASVATSSTGLACATSSANPATTAASSSPFPIQASPLPPPCQLRWLAERSWPASSTPEASCNSPTLPRCRGPPRGNGRGRRMKEAGRLRLRQGILKTKYMWWRRSEREKRSTATSGWGWSGRRGSGGSRGEEVPPGCCSWTRTMPTRGLMTSRRLSRLCWTMKLTRMDLHPTSLCNAN